MSVLSAAQRKHRMDTVTAGKREGLSLPQIAQRLGISYEILRQWLKNKAHQEQCSKLKLPTVQRKCLKCRRDFESQGAHNRLCSSCNSNSHIMSPLAPDPGSSTGRQKQPAFRAS